MRREPQQIRAQQRVKQILDAAEQLFGETGYEATTTNKIAAAAGVPVGSIYQFFESKEAIIGAVAERYGSDLIGCYRSLPAWESPPNAIAITRRILMPMIDYGSEHIHFTKLILSDHAIPSLESTMKSLREQLEASYADILEQAGLRREAAALAGIVALTTILEILARVFAEKSANNVERGEALIEQLFTMLTAYWRALGMR